MSARCAEIKGNKRQEINGNHIPDGSLLNRWRLIVFVQIGHRKNSAQHVNRKSHCKRLASRDFIRAWNCDLFLSPGGRFAGVQ